MKGKGKNIKKESNQNTVKVYPALGVGEGVLSGPMGDLERRGGGMQRYCPKPHFATSCN